MRRLEEIQARFNLGMVETHTQDKFEQNNLSSALWLENYDPNLEFQSVVKRFGQDDHSLPGIASFAVYSSYITDAGHTANIYNARNDALQHFEFMRTAMPIVNDTWVLFKRWQETGKEATGVVGYIPYWNGTGWSLGWKDVWVDAPSPYIQGAYVYGTLTGTDRHGENIVFTTELKGMFGFVGSNYDGSYNDTYQVLMYPNYIWGRFDVTRKREVYADAWLNGIEHDYLNREWTDKSVYHNFIVKHPSKYLKDKNVIGVGYINAANELNNIDGGSLNNVSLVFWANEISRNPYLNEHGRNKFTPDYYQTVPPYSTMEVMNNEDMNADILALYADALTGFKYFYFNIATATVVLNPDGKVVTRQGFVTDSGKVFDYFEIGSAASIYAQDWNYIAGSIQLPNYVQGKVPRPWLKWEQIPIVVTYRIRGVEIIGYRGLMPLPELNGLKVNPAGLGELWNLSTLLAFMREHKELERTMSSVRHERLTSFGHDALNNTTAPYKAYSIILDKYLGLFFSLRCTGGGMKTLIEHEVESIRLYVSRPSSKTLFKSQGLLIPTEPAPITYAKPLSLELDDEDYTQFGLIKEFLIEGRGDHVYDYKDQYTAYKGNAWSCRRDLWSGINDVYWAMPQDDTSWPAVRELSSEPFDPKFQTDTPGNYWPPDFMLWDYPSESPSLALQGSGKYWDGLGAKGITVINSRPFLIDPIDREGNVEQATVRFGAVQSGVSSLDLYNDEDKIKVGHKPLVAATNFREQLIIFSRDQMYRISLPNIFDYSSWDWEYLEVFDGQGTFCQKTLCKTPYGFAYCNEGGIWISDGSKPKCLTNNKEEGLAIDSLYNQLAVGKPYQYIAIANPGAPFIKDGFNPYMELLYDEIKDELVLITQVERQFHNVSNVGKGYDIQQDEFFRFSGNTPTDFELLNYEIRLVYSFPHHNWRVDALDYTDHMLKTSSLFGRVHAMNREIVTAYQLWDSDKLDFNLRFSHPVYNHYVDSYNNHAFYLPIIGQIITHEIGDAKNDALLHSAVIECVPRDTVPDDPQNGWQNFTYSATAGTFPTSLDPIFAYELRNREWNAHVTNPAVLWHDLVQPNMLAKGGVNPFKSIMQTPGGLGTTTETVVARESLTMLAPIFTPFRRARFRFVSDIVVKVKSIILRSAFFKRRNI